MKSDLSFPRSFKLVNKVEFQTVFNQSRKITHHPLLALYKPNKKEIARLGIIVGKRVANFANTRNTIKRIVRESFRAKKDQLSGLDIIIIARQSCSDLSKTQLREGIEKLWQKLLTQYRKPSSTS